MPDDAADKIIMLAGLAGVGERQIRGTGPEVADFPAKAEATEALGKGTYIQPQSALNHARGG